MSVVTNQLDVSEGWVLLKSTLNDHSPTYSVYHNQHPEFNLKCANFGHASLLFAVLGGRQARLFSNAAVLLEIV